MNYAILYGPHQPLAGENPARLERKTAADAFALLKAIEQDHKVAMMLGSEGEQMTRGELEAAARAEQGD